MCKYCESIKKQKIMSYSNSSYMKKDFNGDKIGTSVYGDLYMHGNMLKLTCIGNHKTTSDYWYESYGLECDGDMSNDAPNSAIKIKFCPFCGKNISNSPSNKKVQAKCILDKINAEIDKLETRKCKLRGSLYIHVNTISDEYMNKNADDKSKEVEDARKNGMKLWEEYLPTSLKNIYESGKYSKIRFIHLTPDFIYLNHEDFLKPCDKYRILNIDKTPIEMTHEYKGSILKSYVYEITPATLRQIVKRGYSTRFTEEEISKWENKLNKVTARLAILKNRKKKLTNYIKSL